ncbi:nucleoside triphosphate pyrophosphohydrolase, non-specific [Streptomyces malaysiensis subsp. malaysiensis]|nr:nucleoside triphosphate pyrophosphohydrolase, non-specific [Streptomyces malaysiensis]
MGTAAATGAVTPAVWESAPDQGPAVGALPVVDRSAVLGGSWSSYHSTPDRAATSSSR